MSQGCIVTCTNNISIFSVIAVVFTPWPGLAVKDAFFCPVASDIVQPDDVWPSPIAGTSQSRQRWPTAHLLAHHLGVLHVPVVITHTAPLVLVKHLDSPNTLGWATHEPDWPLLRNVHLCTNAQKINVKGASYTPHFLGRACLLGRGSGVSQHTADMARAGLLWEWGRKTEKPGRGAVGKGQEEAFLVFTDGCRLYCVSPSRTPIMLITMQPRGGTKDQSSPREETI